MFIGIDLGTSGQSGTGGCRRAVVATETVATAGFTSTALVE